MDQQHRKGSSEEALAKSKNPCFVLYVFINFESIMENLKAAIKEYERFVKFDKQAFIKE